MAKKVNKPQDISWLKDYDIDALFDVSGIPKGERDLWTLRAELAKKYERKVVEAAAAGRDITPYKREFVALITTDPRKYFPEEKWSKNVKISSYMESHHTNNLWRNRNATNGLKSNSAVRDLHLMLEEAKNELGNSLQNGESLSPFAHKGSKTIPKGLPGSVANSAHPDNLTKVVSKFDEPLPKGRAQEIINKTAEEKRRVRTAIESDKAIRDITTDTVDSLTEGRVSDVFNQKKLGISKQDLKIIDKNKHLFKQINTHLPTFKNLSIPKGALKYGLAGLPLVTFPLDVNAAQRDIRTAIKKPSNLTIKNAIGSTIEAADQFTPGVGSFINAALRAKSNKNMSKEERKRAVERLKFIK